MDRQPADANQSEADFGDLLVKLARASIETSLHIPGAKDRVRGLESRMAGETFDKKSGVFVTLHQEGRLRGCIGSIEPTRPLRSGVRENALNAAFHDPRFSPVTTEEIEAIDIEVSLLTTPEPLRYQGGDDLISKIRPGVDGLIIRKGSHQATFLPQVWEQLCEPESFLSHLCTKARLPSDEWRHGTLEVKTYQVRYFKE